MNIIYTILSWFGYVEHLKFGAVENARSPLWGKTKKEFEKIHPKVCAVCGNKKVQLHHKQAFHAHPELELDLNNLVWLCEGMLTNNHHIWWGHLGNFQSINDEIEHWIDKRNHRPLWNGKQWITS